MNYLRGYGESEETQDRQVSGVCEHFLRSLFRHILSNLGIIQGVGSNNHDVQ